MTLETDLCGLREVPVLRELPPARLKLLTLMGERLEFGAGARIVEEGEVAEGVYFIIAGEVDLRHVRGDGSEKIFTFRPGAIFGDVTVLCGGGFVGEAVARSDVSLLRLPKDLFFEMMKTVPEFAIAISRDLAGRLNRLADRMLHAEG